MNLPDAPHNSYLAISSDEPHRVIVEPAAPTRDRWFRMFNYLIDSGIWASLPSSQQAMLVVLLRHRQENGLVELPRAILFQQAGLKRSAGSKALQGLLAHDAGLLARHGDALELIPGRRFAGRAPPSAAADTDVRQGGRMTAAADIARAKPEFNTSASQREELENSGFGQNVLRQKTKLATSSTSGWRGSTSRGWDGLEITWTAADCKDVVDALSRLEVNPPYLGQASALPRITVEEVVATALAVRADSTARSKPAVLLHRLWASRGQEMPKGLSHRAQVSERLGPQLAEAVLRLEELQRSRPEDPAWGRHHARNREGAEAEARKLLDSGAEIRDDASP